MKITPSQWIKLVQLISTFIIGVITALTVQSCTASMSVFWKNSNSKQDSQQKIGRASCRERVCLDV